MKHIDIKFYFIRHAISDKRIELIKIDDKFHRANALTKVIFKRVLEDIVLLCKFFMRSTSRFCYHFSLMYLFFTLSCFGYGSISISFNLNLFFVKISSRIFCRIII